jgi:hypothetical protein
MLPGVEAGRGASKGMDFQKLIELREEEKNFLHGGNSFFLMSL